MTGRGGRGNALLQLYLAKQKEIEGAGDAPQGTPQEATPSSVAPAGRGAGRSVIMEHVLQRKEERAADPKPIGRGRALLLAAAHQERQASSSASSVKPPIQEMAAVTIKPPRETYVDKPPVVMKGESGTRIPASANYIHLTVQPDKGIYEYEVKFEPDVDNKRIRYKLLREHKNVIGEFDNFDGAILYLAFLLQEQITVLPSTHPDGTNGTIKIIYKRKRAMGECIHFYNVLLKRIMNMIEMTRIGRLHFDPHASYNIPNHKLEVWPGFVTAIDEYEGGIQLCCDASFKVLRTQTVLDYILDIMRSNPSDYQAACRNLIVGTSIMTKYNYRVYRIYDIDFSKNPKSTFQSRDGTEMTFLDYYRKKHEQNIHNVSQPLLLSKVKTKLVNQTVEQILCLVPEFCYLTGLTDEMRGDFKVMKDLNDVTKLSPNDRQNTIRKFLNNVLSNQKAVELLDSWGLKIANTTVSIDARIVDSEVVSFGGGRSYKVGPDTNWNRQATSLSMLEVVDLNNWAIFHTNRDSNCAMDFSKRLIEFASKMGMNIQRPRLIDLRDDKGDTYVRALRENYSKQLQLVVIIFPKATTDRYSAVKKFCYVEKAVASQVINSRTIYNPRNPSKINSCIQKIALQINCKLGGSLWAIKIPFKNAMICGIDSYHDAKQRGHSVGAFVASMNRSVTQWFSVVSMQTPGQEFIDSLKLSFMKALRKYNEINRTYPDVIIIYRDGVGDGQLNICAEYEVPQFRRAMHDISQDYNPQIAMIITQKRINTRIFAQNSRDNRFENPVPGTIVDHSITRRNYYDFFLVSQHVREGTVTPTHYIVVHNTTALQPDHMQKLTYKMCHLYYNWPGTIRVPAPCQYAHKVAYLVGQNIHRLPNEELSDKLFYL